MFSSLQANAGESAFGDEPVTCKELAGLMRQKAGLTSSQSIHGRAIKAGIKLCKYHDFTVYPVGKKH